MVQIVSVRELPTTMSLLVTWSKFVKGKDRKHYWQFFFWKHAPGRSILILVTQKILGFPSKNPSFTSSWHNQPPSIMNAQFWSPAWIGLIFIFHFIYIYLQRLKIITLVTRSITRIWQYELSAASNLFGSEFGQIWPQPLI